MKPHLDLLYSELDCLSNYSFLNGASHPEELISRAAELGYKALALCDYASMAGVVRAYAQAKLHPEIRLLVGSRFRFTGAWDSPNPQGTNPEARASNDTQAHELLILPRNKEGYGNLCQFISHLHQSLDLKQEASIDWSFLQQARQGAQQQVLPDCLLIYKPAYGLDSEHIQRQTQNLLDLFAGRLFLGVSLHRRDQDMQHLRAVRQAAQTCGVRCAALGGVHMHVRSRQPLHDTLAAIRLKTPVQECGWSLASNAEHHLRTRFQLANLYPAELRETTEYIQELCQFCLSEIKYEYPVEIVPPGLSGIEYLRQETERGAQRRYPKGISDSLRTRLEEELSLIADLGYESYFLTLHDIVGYARSQGILCQGRGSAANSAVCYCLGITEVDPASSHTLFARFISRARAEPPDIDVDFEHQRREEVIQYIYRKYGRQRAALTAVITTYRRRSALRDTGKALRIPQALIEALIQCDRAWLKDTHIQDEVLARFPECPPEQAHQWLSLTRQLMGFPRHLSQHPGGFVISQTPLHRLVPIQNAAMPGRSVVQWDKDDLDVLGLLKVDILALGMLSALRRCLDTISQQKGKPFRLQDIPLQSAKTFRMIRRADTIGVFQIESRAQMSMLPRLRPQCFYDLVVQVAIVRPGPIQGGMVHPYLERRRDHSKVDYPAPEIRHVLERTLGVPIFQEQAMELAMEAAGFSADKADALRRAMAAWRRRGGLGPFEQELLDGMDAKGYAPEFAQRLFDQISGFGEYGFPESHSASFAKLAWFSAYLKARYPEHFLAALLNSQPMGFYGPSQLVQDARRHGVQVLPVDVQYSLYDSHVCSAPGSSRQVRLGLHMVKGLSEQGAQAIVSYRQNHPERKLNLACLRQELALSAHDQQALAQAHALRSAYSQRRHSVWDARRPSQTGLLSHAETPDHTPDLPRASVGLEVLSDYQAVGLSLDRHPLSLLRTQLAPLRFSTAEQLNQACPDRRLARACGLVTTRQRPGTAKGTVFVTLEDETGSVNVIVREELAQAQSQALLQSRLLGVYGVWQRDGSVCHLIARRLVSMNHLVGDLAARSRDFQ